MNAVAAVLVGQMPSAHRPRQIHSVQRMNADGLMDEAAAAHPGQLLRLGPSVFMRAFGDS